ncbi:MAG TPA: DJ-1/PfpI family protein [Clostridiaceae bacterium]|nr:DJ-1/PfpI family protein [Clostridiaceae bacterium]
MAKKNVIVFLAEGFETIEALTPVDYLRRAKAEVVTCSWNNKYEVTSAQKVTVFADQLIADLSQDQIAQADLIVIPGGQPGANNLKATIEVISALQQVFEQGGLVSAICAGPLVLAEAGLLNGKRFTCYPGVEDSIKDGQHENKLVVRDGNVITAKGPGAAMDFSLELIGSLLDKRISDLIAETTFSNESLKSY